MSLEMFSLNVLGQAAKKSWIVICVQFSIKQGQFVKDFISDKIKYVVHDNH